MLSKSKSLKVFIAAALLASCAGRAEAIVIQLDYAQDARGFFNDPFRRGALERAAATLGALLTDSLLPIASGNGNSWTATFFNPSTGDAMHLPNLTIAQNTLRVFAGGRPLAEGQLGEGGFGGYSVSGSAEYLHLVQLRGQSDFGPWGGSLTFDEDTDWFTGADADAPELAGKFDLYSVALHELGHLLGLGTSQLWDSHLSNGAFTGASSVALNGGEPVRLFEDLSHWALGTQSVSHPFGEEQAAAMEPLLMAGERKHFTQLDLAALEDIGWQVVPEPVTGVALIGGLGLLCGRRMGRRRG